MSMAERDADRMRGGLATGIQRAADAYAVAQADGDRPDSPSMTKAFAESLEAMYARNAELNSEVWKLEGLLKDHRAKIDSLMEPCPDCGHAMTLDEEGTLLCEMCIVHATIAKQAEEIQRLEAENAALKAKLAIPVKIVETWFAGYMVGRGTR